MSEILTNEMMCAAEILAAATAVQARLAAMHEANRVRHGQDYASAYGEGSFDEVASELENEVNRLKRHWIG